LFGHVDGAVNYSAGFGWTACLAALNQVKQAAALAHFRLAATGLYFKALTQGLSAIPAVPEDVRAGVRAARRASGADLHASLMRRRIRQPRRDAAERIRTHIARARSL